MQYLFETSSYDTKTGEFLRDQKALPAEPMVISLLECFLRNPNQLLTKSDLIDAVWGGRAISDSTLSSCVKSVRKLIGDDGTNQRLLRTVHGRGFRFVAEVRSTTNDHTDRKAAIGSPRSHSSTTPGLAILPFECLNCQSDVQAFAMGIADDLANAMSKWRLFPVIGRFETAPYIEQSVSMRDLSKSLGAGHILTGAVRSMGRKLRVSLQLVEGHSGKTVWSDNLDREMGNKFEIQDQISRQVAATIAPVLENFEWLNVSSGDQDAMTARELSFRGHSLLNQYTPRGNEEARSAFESALKLNPDHARTHVGIAYSHHRDLFWNYSTDRAASIAAMQKSAESAVICGGNDATSRIVMAYSHIWCGQYQYAISEAIRAVEINPSDSFCHIVLAEAQDMLGDHRSALENAEIGIRLNEQHHRVHTFLGVPARIQLAAGNFAEAERWANRTLLNRPDYPHGKMFRAVAVANGDPFSSSEILIPPMTANPAGLAFCYQDRNLVDWFYSEFLKIGCQEEVLNAQLPTLSIGQS